MDSAKFKEIFSKENYQLPMRWDGKDFYATLYKHLKDYREDIEKNCDNPNLCAEVKAVCRGICFAVDHSFKGYPEKAYKSFEAVMEILGKDPLLIDMKDINKEPLYRVVDVGNAALPKRQRVFHVPFNMRSKMSTQRYSIPGFPCLYLGTSLELCLMEIGKDPKRDYVCVSRYELETDRRIISRLFEDNQSPVFDNDEFKIFDVSVKPNGAIEKLCHNYEEITKYIKWYPLISACSYIRTMRDSPYSAEYITPQLFIQWVRLEDEDAVVGIKYFSCASVYVSTLGNNYVFPTMGIPYQTRKTIKDYCARLSHRFKLTAPRFLMEFESIDDCEDAIIEDNDLKYIEDYNTGEDGLIVGEYMIPEGVSAIGAFAFSGCSSLTSINIPDSVITIGERAFLNCSSLTSITLPDSVITISKGAFLNCSSLTKTNIPDSVTTIGDRAFYGCSLLTKIAVNSSNEYYTSVDGILYNKSKNKLLCYPAGKNQTSFVIPSEVTSIGDNAFSGCSSLTSIKIPDSVTDIGNDAFYRCSSLTSIKIPDSVTDIGNDAFYRCSSLTSIIILDNVTTIGEKAFSGCSSLTSIEIPDRVITISDSVFSFCSSLTSISIPNSVTTIGNFAFYGCSSLTSIEIPDRVITISDSVFSFCSSLTSISIPNSVTNIGNDAFSGCSSLAKITVNSSNEYYTSVDGILYNKSKNKLLCYPAGRKQTSFVIPSEVTNIGDNAFYGCSSLTSIIILDNVTTIGEKAFSGCSSLTSFNIPDSVTTIGSFAFFGCSSLTSFNIPDSVTTIGSFAFFGCSLLTSFNIPDSVKSIGYLALCECSSLTKITVNSSNEYYTSVDGVLYDKDKTKLLCYPAGRKQTSFVIPSEVTNIGDNAFSGCSSLTSIIILDNVTTIGEKAFCECSSLTNISIPDSVTTIGENAFLSCSSLEKITVNSSNEHYTSVDGILYDKDKTKLICYPAKKNQTSFAIPSDAMIIDGGAFSDCSSLEKITVNSSNEYYTSVDGILYNKKKTHLICYPAGKKRISFAIPFGVANIGRGAFSGCSSLTSITIPDSVTTIGDGSFYGCSSLTNIKVNRSNKYYTSVDGVLYNKKKTHLICYPAGKKQISFAIPSDVTSIGDNAFSGCSSLTSIKIPESVTDIGAYAFLGCDTLDTVYYSGTQEQAKKLIVYSDECLQNARWEYGSSGIKC